MKREFTCLLPEAIRLFHISIANWK